MAAAGFFGFGKKEEILFPERKTWKSGNHWTQDDLVQRHFRTESLDDIYTIKASEELGRRAQEETAKLKPALTIYYINDTICYRQKDESRLYDFLIDLEKRIEKERPTKPVASQPERKLKLSSAIGTAERQMQTTDNPLTQATGAVEVAQKPSVPAQSEPQSDIENRWAEESLAEELQEIQEEIEEADAMLAVSKEPVAERPVEQRKKRKSLGRTNQIMTRLTDAELVQFQRRVRKSGLAQGDFLRSAALTGQIVLEERSAADIALLDELSLLRAEIGRQGGMLKMIIKPNEGQRELLPNEWEELIRAIREVEKMKQRLIDLEVKLNGNSQT